MKGIIVAGGSGARHYVDDHVRALLHVALKGNLSETYNIGRHNEVTNINLVKTVCSILDELAPSEYDNIDKYEQSMNPKGHY